MKTSGRQCMIFMGLVLMLSGCGIQLVNPEITQDDKHSLLKGKPEIGSYEVPGISLNEARAVSADLLSVLVANFPPAKHKLVFRPPEAVLGWDLRDRLRQAGYGVVNGGNGPELTYLMDIIDKKYYRVTLRLQHWRLSRLYGYQGQRFVVFGSGTNGGVTVVKPLHDAKKVRGKRAVNHQRPAAKTVQKKRSLGGRKGAAAHKSVAFRKAKVTTGPEKKPLRQVYFVQVMAGANAQTLKYNQSLLQERGYRVGIMPLQRKRLSALRVGIWLDRQKALQALDVLKNNYHDAFIWEALI